MKPEKKIKSKLSKEMEGSIAIAETGGGTVSNFAIEIEKKIDAKKITPEKARQLIIKYHCDTDK